MIRPCFSFVVGTGLGIYVAQNYNVPNLNKLFHRGAVVAKHYEETYRKPKSAEDPAAAVEIERWGGGGDGDGGRAGWPRARVGWCQRGGIELAGENKRGLSPVIDGSRGTEYRLRPEREGVGSGGDIRDDRHVRYPLNNAV